MKKNAIVAISGPTASGKTDLAIYLAKKFNGEIINADSRTIYREMDVATSKPTTAELNEVPHHLFDIINPDEEFTLADYMKLAKEKIAEIQNRGKIPFVVGGTGLYIDAIVYDFNLTEAEPNPELRSELEAMNEDELFAKLGELDPLTADNIDKNNKRRLIRALEVVITTNKSFYESKRRKSLPENVLYLSIDVDREKLYEKINTRVDSWLDQGLIEETEHLVHKYPLNLPSMSSIGYKEISLALNCESEITIQEALDLMKRRTRNYAKRQMTWLKRNKDLVWVKNNEEAEKEIRGFLNYY